MRTLIAFSGLAWNLKSTIIDRICDQNPSFKRLQQTNKANQDGAKTPVPKELMKIFLEANKELIESKEDQVVISDRALIDYFVYDIMMNPIYSFRQNEFLSGEYDEVCQAEPAIAAEESMEFFKHFDRILIVSLQNSNLEFIESTFQKQPYSSTAYIFDNPVKYNFYSNYFNIVADKIFHYLKPTMKNHNKKYQRLFFKFNETETADKFINRVCSELNYPLMYGIQ